MSHRKEQKPHATRKHDPKTIFDFIVRFKMAHDGNSPSIRELAEACGISSTNTVSVLLDRLEELGCIRLNGGFGVARRIEVVDGEWRLKSNETIGR